MPPDTPDQPGLDVPAQAWPDWPVYGLEGDLLPAAEACVARNQDFALATLVRIEGSSPRALGAEMMVSATGRAHGYVSGGCVEAAVVREAQDCLRDGNPRLLHFGQGSPFIDIPLTCGGSIHVLVRRVDEPRWWVAQLRNLRACRRPCHMLSDLTTGAMQVITEEQAAPSGYFVKRYEPTTRLVLVGSDPVTLATAMLGRASGMEIILWRPQGPSLPPRCTELDRYVSHPVSRGLTGIGLDAYSALYCLTHDLDIETAILGEALATDAFCVGVLGSRLKRSLRFQRLREAGVDEAALAKLRSPAGLAIGAVDPHGIALSILAEVVLQRTSMPLPEAHGLERARHPLVA